MRVVPDTNVLVSGTFWRGKSHKILELIDGRKIRFLISQQIVEEYRKVISSEEIVKKTENFRLIFSDVIERILSLSILIDPEIRLDVVKEDPDDNKVLECAKDGRADYIITQDNHLLKLKKFEGIQILTPEEFIEVIEGIRKRK
ncbi:MAG: putative toxin-antitoxin system toxin component, PIN family [Nanoarchaeota archaeon]|nr:putative toxin-antitoxin system toxin component, PIN family [Nanoarchaeota archaeon]